MTDEADALYRAPLADFVRVREEIAARLKAAGDRSGAAAVKATRKPTVPAWAANQVVWSAPGEWQRLQAAAAALRRGHESGASPDEIRQASREQREALSACESRVAGFLVAHGHAATPLVVRKAGATLQALAYGAAGAMPGRASEELSPPGFEALAGLGLVAAAPPAAPTGTPPAASTRGVPSAEPPASFAEAARRRAEERARESRRAARASALRRDAEAREALAAARARAAETDRRRDELEQALAAARAEAVEASRAVGAAEAEAAAAASALEALREADAGAGG